MKRKQIAIIFWVGVLALAVVLAAYSPAQASGVLPGPQPQETEAPLPEATVPVPETGGEQASETDALGSWVLWIFLGVIVLGIIIALVARGGSSYR